MPDKPRTTFKSTVSIGAASFTLNGKTYTRPPSERHIHEVGTAKYSGPAENCPICKTEKKRKLKRGE